MQTHFPHLLPVLETYFLTCFLHDIGTTPDHMKGTHLSFEYWGAMKARSFLSEHGSPHDQADAVCEAIIRHAELGESGMITSLGLLIQLSTVFGKSLVVVSTPFSGLSTGTQSRPPPTQQCILGK